MEKSENKKDFEISDFTVFRTPPTQTTVEYSLKTWPSIMGVRGESTTADQQPKDLTFNYGGTGVKVRRQTDGQHGHHFL